MTAWEKIKGATYYILETPYHLVKKRITFALIKQHITRITQIHSKTGCNIFNGVKIIKNMRVN